jgi:hypothetical protein
MIFASSRINKDGGKKKSLPKKQQTKTHKLLLLPLLLPLLTAESFKTKLTQLPSNTSKTPPKSFL